MFRGPELTAGLSELDRDRSWGNITQASFSCLLPRLEIRWSLLGWGEGAVRGLFQLMEAGSSAGDRHWITSSAPAYRLTAENAFS